MNANGQGDAKITIIFRAPMEVSVTVEGLTPVIAAYMLDETRKLLAEQIFKRQENRVVLPATQISKLP